MTQDETPPRLPIPWTSLVVAAFVVGLAACTAHLQPSGAPRAPAPTATAAPRKATKAKRVLRGAPSPSPTASPSPIPRLSHLDVPIEETGATVPEASTAAGAELAPPAVAPSPLAAAGAAVETIPTPVAIASPGAAVATPAAAIGAVAAPAAPPAHATGTAILERRGDFLVSAARLNGQPIGDLLLDTGAGATFIDQRIADERRLPEMIAAATEGANAEHEASIRELVGLSLGDLALSTERAFVVDLQDGAALVGTPIAGVIGLSALGANPFTLDFTTGTLTIATDATFEPPTRAQADALRMDQGLPFVEATLADGSTVWLLLDTGSAPAITVWRGFAKQHPGIIKSVAAPAAPAPLGTPNPETLLPTATPTPEPPRGSELRSFRIFGEKYDRMPVLVQDPPPRAWQRARVVGRVGMALLRDLRITIHPATERIWVERLRLPSAH